MSNPKYIEREAVLRILRRYSLETGSCIGRHSGAVDEAMAIVEQLPFADVVLVVHGEWCQDESEFEESKHKYEFCSWRCPICAHELEYVDPISYNHLPHYCPNCGAKMDAGKTDEDLGGI